VLDTATTGVYLDSDTAKRPSAATEGDTMTSLNLGYDIRAAIEDGDLDTLRTAIRRLQRIPMLFEHERGIHDNLHDGRNDECPSCQHRGESRST
jgi:hypothetical protein